MILSTSFTPTEKRLVAFELRDLHFAKKSSARSLPTRDLLEAAVSFRRSNLGVEKLATKKAEDDETQVKQ